jgi:hypothetical protein
MLRARSSVRLGTSAVADALGHCPLPKWCGRDGSSPFPLLPVFNIMLGHNRGTGAPPFGAIRSSPPLQNLVGCSFLHGNHHHYVLVNLVLKKRLHLQWGATFPGTLYE